jgi:hypothetical protein
VPLSRFAVGSSANTTRPGGLRARARSRPACRWPPERRSGRTPELVRQADRLEKLPRAAAPLGGGPAASPAGTRRSPPRLRTGIRLNVWNTKPNRSRRRSDRSFSDSDPAAAPFEVHGAGVRAHPAGRGGSGASSCPSRSGPWSATNSSGADRERRPTARRATEASPRRYERVTSRASSRRRNFGGGARHGGGILARAARQTVYAAPASGVVAGACGRWPRTAARAPTSGKWALGEQESDPDLRSTSTPACLRSASQRFGVGDGDLVHAVPQRADALRRDRHRARAGWAAIRIVAMPRCPVGIP